MVAIVQVATPVPHALHPPAEVRYNPLLQVLQLVALVHTEQPKEQDRH